MTTCHATAPSIQPTGGKIALVGNPNVGKSILFHRLTGQYVVVSNYPGTTVEIAQGSTRAIPDAVIIDTPGIVAFPARSEDEAVTARVLLGDPLQAVLQVGDAKNLRRTLHLAVQLAEMRIPQALALNMMDEANARGLELDIKHIAHALNVPVAATVATRGKGLDNLIDAVSHASVSTIELEYPQVIEEFLAYVDQVMPSGRISSRALGLFWLAGDITVDSWLCEQVGQDECRKLIAMRDEIERVLAQPAYQVISHIRESYVNQLATEALHQTRNEKQHVNFNAWLSHVSTHPVWGIPFLALILYGLYWFVGVFGAGTLVGLIEENLFGEIINPWVVETLQRLIPWQLIVDLLVGEYGLWTMGATYAFALLLPVVVTFFIAFGVLEDSGYLPRMAVLTNKLFSWMGLNGQAVLPMVLGLGCVTMATMTTRILQSRRERLLVTMLLALAVPCSAQLGVVLGMLAGISLTAALIWGGVVMGVLLLVGWLAAQLTPGKRSPLMVELPPLRLPVMSNVLVKTAARLEWYIKEAVPLFLVGTLMLFALDKLRVLPWLIQITEPVVTGWLGLPAESASAFLLGLMRRDFAATGLFHMQNQGSLSPLQVIVSIVTITLFIPCIASVFMIVKERGGRMALAMTAFIFPFALLVGGLLYRVLLFFGWS